MDRKTYILDLLRKATADRRAHSRLLDELIEWHEQGRPGGDETEPGEGPGVSFAYACALAGDVDVAFHSERQSRQLDYPQMRRKNAESTARRTHTTSPSGTGLEQLFGGNR